VADRALGGLKNLKILSLSGNKIVALPTIFEDSKEITEIYLQNNSLSSLSPKLFAGLDQLVVLDLSHNILSNFLSQDRLANDINDTATTSQPALTSAGGEIFSGLIRLVLLNLGYNRYALNNIKIIHDSILKKSF
jgi:Leucine-rich repeat (LRR) protein